MSHSFTKKPDHGPHAALSGLGVLTSEQPRPRLDANGLERIAKERPDECFLKGSGVLKLIDGIRRLEGQMRVAVALLNECAGPLEVSAAVIEDEGGGEAIETLINRVKTFVAAFYLSDAPAFGLAPAPDLSEQGRNRSAVLGSTMQVLTEGGLPFVQALDATLKAFDHGGSAAPDGAHPSFAPTGEVIELDYERCLVVVRLDADIPPAMEVKQRVALEPEEIAGGVNTDGGRSRG